MAYFASEFNEYFSTTWGLGVGGWGWIVIQATQKPIIAFKDIDIAAAIEIYEILMSRAI